MRRVLLLAATTGYQTRSFAQAAQSVGVAVQPATDRCHVLPDPWGDHAAVIRFDEPHMSADILAASSSEIGGRIDGIVAVGDGPTVIAALTAQRLGLRWHPPHAVEACRNKRRMRKIFADAGLPSPRDRPPVAFPCVLKPVGLSASRGVIRADNPFEFDAALTRIRAIVGEEAEIQVEEYIPGREFAVEGLMTDGIFQPLAIFDKPDPLEGPYFEETIYVTLSRELAQVQEEIIATTTRALTALGLHHGPIHAEMRVNDTGVYMLEIAARPIGGLCSRALRFRAAGIERLLTLEEIVILHAIGAMPEDLLPASLASGVMMIPVPRAGIFQAADGVEQARSVPGVDDVIITAKQGERLTPLPEGGSYPGFIFASGRDAESVEDSLRSAHALLRFEVLTALDVVV